MPKSYYPPVTLKKALIIPNAIFEKNAGKPIFRVTLAEELGYKSESRVFRDLITASAGYGLTSGSYISEKLALEQVGNELAHGNVEFAYKALFSIEVFKKFYDNFGSGGSRGIPSEKAAKDFLQNECGVPESQSKSVFENVIHDAKEWLLIQNIAGGDKFVPIELAKGKAGGLLQTPMVDTENSETNIPTESPSPENHQELAKAKPILNVSPGLQLNIQIHIAADTSDDKIETIFKNMRKYLLSNGE